LEFFSRRRDACSNGQLAGRLRNRRYPWVFRRQSELRCSSVEDFTQPFDGEIAIVQFCSVREQPFGVERRWDKSQLPRAQFIVLMRVRAFYGQPSKPQKYGMVRVLNCRVLLPQARTLLCRMSRTGNACSQERRWRSGCKTGANTRAQ
jgi:hypothetical protein